MPDLVGRDYVESEKELAAMGLKLKRRADRPSAEKINTLKAFGAAAIAGAAVL